MQSQDPCCQHSFFTRTRRNQLNSESTPSKLCGRGPPRRVFGGRSGIRREEVGRESLGNLMLSDVANGCVCVCVCVRTRARDSCATPKWISLRAGKHGSEREREGERERAKRCLAWRTGPHSRTSFVAVARGTEARARYRWLMAVLIITSGNLGRSGRWGRFRMNFSENEKNQSVGGKGSYPTRSA